MVEIEDGVLYCSLIGDENINLFSVDRIESIELDLGWSIGPRVSVSYREPECTVLYREAADLDNYTIKAFLKKLRKSGFRVPKPKDINDAEENFEYIICGNRELERRDRKRRKENGQRDARAGESIDAGQRQAGMH